MRKLLALTAAAALFAVAACSNGETENSSPTNGGDGGGLSGAITFWMYPVGAAGEESYWEPIIEEFQEDHPDSEINVVIQPFQRRAETLLTALAGTNPPDVVYFNPSLIPQFADQGALLPLDDLVADDREDYHESALADLSFQDELYSVPVLMSASLHFCDRQVMDELGAEECPSTWDDLVPLMELAAQNGKFGMFYEGAPNITMTQTFFPYVWMAGGEVLSEDGTQAAFNSPEGLKALTFLRTAVDNGWLDSSSITEFLPFEQTQAAQRNVAFLGSFNAASIAQFIPEEDLMLSEGPLSDAWPVAVGSVGGYAVTSTSENQDLAKAWVSYLAETDNVEQFLIDTDYLSARTSLTGLHPDNKFLTEGENRLEYVRTTIDSVAAGAISDTVGAHVQAALLGQKTPEQALADAEEEVNNLLAQHS